MERPERSTSILKIVIIISFLLAIGCKEDNTQPEKIIGKWQLIKGYDLANGFYSVITEDKRIEEYTRDNERIRYDYLNNEIARCTYNATESSITIYAEIPDKEVFESTYEYWFEQDTLVIHNDGGNHFYNEFFISID